MKKFYEKHELLFAIFWIVVYTVAMGNLRNLGDDSPWMMLGLIVISALMFLFVRKNGLMEYYGLSGWAKNNRAMLWFIPLWIIASCNLWGGVAPEYPLPGQIFIVINQGLQDHVNTSQSRTSSTPRRSDARKNCGRMFSGSE